MRVAWWCNGGVANMRSRGRRFDPQLGTAVGKLFTPMCLCHQAVLFGTGVKAGEAGYGRGVVYHP